MSRYAAILIFAAVQWASLSTQAQEFTFNAGTNEGWTYRLINTTTGGEIRSGAAVWADATNFPLVIGDPLGDSQGSAGQLVGGVDYAVPQVGHFLILQLISPDLSSSTDWQDTFSFATKLAPVFVADALTPDLFANVGIAVDDLDTGTQRSFVNGSATTINAFEWSEREFDFSAAFAGASPPVVNYVVRNVVVNFWIAKQVGKGISDVLFFAVDDMAGCDCPDIAICQPFDDELAFRAEAGVVTTYGFEVNGLSENVNDLPPSPVPASDFDGHFDIAYTNLNGFNVANSPGSSCNTDGVKSLFSHSVVASDYTLTFSNFGNAGQAITAFGLTVCDFASNISVPAEITYDTGTRSGTLLAVPNGQPDFSLNFMGLVVKPSDAFTSITLTFDDNLSGFQNFDEVIYAPEPSFLGGIAAAMGFLGLLARRRAHRT